MSFTGNFTSNAFKTALLEGGVDFGSDTLKIALYDNTATLDQTIDVYTTVGEVVASGYTAGGLVLTPSVAALDGVSFVSFDNVSWSGAITARGALIYKLFGTAVCVLDFGADRTSTTTFTVAFPPASNTSAILRLQ